MANGGVGILNGSPALPLSKDCCGCAACLSACASGAILMCPDDEGFLHPHVNATVCRNCGACLRACPVLKRREPHKPSTVYAARARDAGVRRRSSSGGVFSLLARRVLAQGGSVFGVRCNLTDGEVEFAEARTEGELAALRGSKYVQASVGTVYREVKARLEAGHAVLFSGTPCQVAGLKSFLVHDHDQLVTVDFVCHGVPSPLAWRKYLEGHGRRNFKEILFRDKRSGWHRYVMRVVTSDGKSRCGRFRGYTYLWGFLSNLFDRPSCHACPFRGGRNVSDITLGDFWGIERRNPELDDNQGTSLVLAQTEKGDRLLSTVQGEVESYPSDWETAVEGNPSLVEDVPPHGHRKLFFDDLKNGCSFDVAAKRALGMRFFDRICKKIVHMFGR